MKIGFTGTRHGMTQWQKDCFYEWICCESDIHEFHHGDCIGADDEAADILHDIAIGEDPGPPITVIGHPPADQRKRAFNTYTDYERPAKPYLERNRDIVDACDVLIACPAEETEQQRGGTWSTVRYARKVGKPVVLILPSGKVIEE